jgi:hypothetical protein
MAKYNISSFIYAIIPISYSVKRKNVSHNSEKLYKKFDMYDIKERV